MSIKKGNRQMTIDDQIKVEKAIQKQKKKRAEIVESFLDTKSRKKVVDQLKEMNIPEPIMHDIPPVKIRWKTQFNAHLFPSRAEKITAPSITVPDMTLSIPEIIERHTSGLDYGNGKVPLYSGGSDLLDGINPNTLDLSEKFDILETAKLRYQEREQELRNQQEALRKQEFEDIVAQEVETRLKEKAPQA